VSSIVAVRERPASFLAATTTTMIQRPLGNATSTAAGDSSLRSNGHHPQHGQTWSSAFFQSSSSSSNQWLGVTAAAAVFGATALTLEDFSERIHVTRCDDDPYDNLPEQDEPTHCSICQTYRQGPCRPYWRKVEACTKDHEVPDKPKDDDVDETDDENRPDPPCLKYMMPWIDCASGYRNLYALIELDTNYTEGIADLEATASRELCWAPRAEPTVDWSAWQDYLELLHPDWQLPKATESDAKQHFWKTLDHSQDPELVQVEAKVPNTMGEGILECAYALDQNGHVIGFAYGTKPSEAAAAKDKKESKEESGDSDMVSMTIRILPTGTRHVVVAASYTHVNEEKKKAAEKDKVSKDDGIESHIYKSRPLRLDIVTNRNNVKVNIAA
jgi:hypothetical protein